MLIDKSIILNKFILLNNVFYKINKFMLWNKLTLLKNLFY